jgi:hypothetical protein
VDSVKLSGPEVASVAWIDSVQSAEFNTLIDAKRRSIVPMIVIYVVGYMGLSVLAGFGRGILSVKVLRPINLGFALIGPAYLGAGAIWPSIRRWSHCRLESSGRSSAASSRDAIMSMRGASTK